MKKYSLESFRINSTYFFFFLFFFFFFSGATTIEQYCLRRDAWRQVATMSGRRLQFGVAVLDGRLYVVGGRDGLKTLNTVECYNPHSKTWSVMPPMSTHRHGLGEGSLTTYIFFSFCFRFWILSQEGRCPVWAVFILYLKFSCLRYTPACLHFVLFYKLDFTLQILIKTEA